MKSAVTTELVLPDTERITQLDQIASKYASALGPSASPFKNALTLAVAMQELRAILTEEMMRPIMGLMNSPLGFMTDRTGQPKKGQTAAAALYGWEEVRDCVIECTLRGFSVVGNEFNIIAGRFYAAKAGVLRKVLQYPCLTDFKDTYAVPRNKEGGALVTCSATWILAGKPDAIEKEFAIKGDANYTSADAYLGKATRKLCAAILHRLNGSIIPEGEVTDAQLSQAINVTSSAKPAVSFDFDKNYAAKRAAIIEELTAMNYSEKWFVEGLRKLLGNETAKQGGIIEDLVNVTIDNILKEGVGAMVKAIKECKK